MFPNHSCKILVIGGSGSGKINVLLNLMKHQRQNLFIHQRSIWIKYQLLIIGRKKAWIKELKNPRAFIDYDSIDDAYENLEE